MHLYVRPATRLRSFGTRILVTVAVLLLPAPSPAAQSPVDPAGHWEGTIHAPDSEIVIGIDLFRNNNAQFAATFAQPSDGITALPFSTVEVTGRKVRLVLRSGTGGGTFQGALSADGKSMSGDFVTVQGGYVVPFNLTRTGEARTTPAPKSPRITKELEGTWTGTLDVSGKPMRLRVTMTNEPDGTSSGTVISLDGSNVDVPIAIAQDAANVTLGISPVNASISATLNASGNELTGHYTQGGVSLPLTLRRAAK
jgi:hypothetical protein